MSEKDLMARFNELHEKMQQVPVVKAIVFSNEAINEFFRGFDHPVIGTLEYIKMHTSFYERVECTSSCALISNVTITDYNSYCNLFNELKKLKIPCTLDFTFSLSMGIFPFLNNIQETFSVYFTNDEYQIQYIDNENQLYTIDKKYMTHITPDEIRNLRDRVAETIIAKVSTQVDANI